MRQGVQMLTAIVYMTIVIWSMPLWLKLVHQRNSPSHLSALRPAF